MESTQRIVIILSAVLLALLVAFGVIYVFVTPSKPASEIPPSSSAAPGFDLSALDRAQYRQLDQRPIQDNALPVHPPDGVGRPNPFL